MGLDRMGFVEEVNRIRGDSAYRNMITNGDVYDYGLEKALLLAYHRVSQDNVRESGRVAENSLREGFPEFLQDKDRGRVIIFSAGVRDWLVPFYNKFIPKNFEAIGTTLYVDAQGKYTGIKKPCGMEGKPARIKEALQGLNNSVVKIGVGDSRGDRKMFDYVLESHGLTIGIGSGIDGDINVPEDSSWHPVKEAGKLYASIIDRAGTATTRAKEYAIKNIRNSVQGITG